jgi:hypothetical protein
MKFILLTKFLAVAFLATALCPLATLRAQAPVDYALAPSAVTMALVIKKTAPGTFMRQEAGGSFKSPKVATDINFWTTPTTSNSEYVTRMASTRYGNAQLLDDLVAEGVITNKAGVGVVLKYNAVTNPMLDDNGDPMLDDETGEPLTYESYEPVLALRKGTEIIEVVQKASFEVNPRAYASASSYSSSYTIRTGVATGKGKGRDTTEGALSVIVTSPTLGSVELNGLLLVSSSDFYWYPNPNNRWEFDSINVPGISKLTGLVGAEDLVDSSVPGVITGSITAAASKAIKK